MKGLIKTDQEHMFFFSQELREILSTSGKNFDGGVFPEITYELHFGSKYG